MTFWQAVLDGTASAARYVYYGRLSRDYVDFTAGVANGLTGGILQDVGQWSGVYTLAGSTRAVAFTLTGTAALIVLSFGVGYGALAGVRNYVLIVDLYRVSPIELQPPATLCVSVRFFRALRGCVQPPALP